MEVTVQPGDSLWTIAVAYQGDSTKDVRDLVYQIQKWNNLDGAIIHPGQTIEIPLQP